MKIENHAWSDSDIGRIDAGEDFIDFVWQGSDDYLSINKTNPKAIAEHFGLIGGHHDIAALIKEYDPPKDWKDPDFNDKAHRFDWKDYTDDLADEWHLLTDKQKIIISAGAAHRADMSAEHCFD